MKLSSSAPKNAAINVRCNEAERAMIEAVRNTIRPRVSASRLLLFLCEEKARAMGVIKDEKNGEWTIDA